MNDVPSNEEILAAHQGADWAYVYEKLYGCPPPLLMEEPTTIRRGVDEFALPMAMSTAKRLEIYHEHLQSKVHIQACDGIDVPVEQLHPALRTRPFEHQGAIVNWALRGGKRLIAAQFGLGKTTCSSEIARQIHLATGGKALIIGELNVKYQFQQVDGPRLGMDIVYVRNDAEVNACASPYMYTNYERVRDGGISPEALKRFTVVLLDEASVLADYGSKTFQTFCELFKDTPYKFAASATPARNKYKELLHYAHWLGIADSGQALTRYFKRNSQKANELTLMASMEKEFWMWVASWALFVEKPSDLGYPDDGYIMPELEINWTCIPTDHTAAWEQMDGWGQRFLIANAAAGVTQAAKEKRRSMDDRLAKMMEIIGQHPDESFILWHNLEDERKAIKKLLPDAVDVYGSQDIEEKEEKLMAFSRGEFKYLSTKPSIAGRGCNFQHHCHNMIFVGVGYSFEEIIQALHRLYRFMQTHPVRVWFIYTEAEQDIVNVILRKWGQHEELVKNTTAIIKQYGLTEEAMKAEMRRSIGVNRQVVTGQMFTAIHNDAVQEMPHFADNSVDLICTSIPFGTQYEYTEKINDFGYNDDNAAFWSQMDYLIPEMYRVVGPGRIVAVHVKDRIRFGNVTGMGVPTIEPFSDDCSYSFRKHGFLQLARVTVANDVVRENNQTYRLTYSEMVKDGTKMGAGTNEYWLIFRKPQTDKSKAYADVPVTHEKPHRSWQCSCCGLALRYLVGLETIPVDVWEPGSGEDPVQKPVCPNCNSIGSFLPVDIGGYPLYHWQIDADGLQRSSGNRLLKPEEVENHIRLYAPEELADMDTNQIYRWWREYSRTHQYDRAIHRNIARELDRLGRQPRTFSLFAPAVPEHYADTILSVHDYSRMRVLNAQQMQRRQENHVCPLPLDLIEWVIERFSNPDDLVYDPFGGIGSTVYQAIKMHRRGVFTELNYDYWRAGVQYCKEIEIEKSAPTLFDLMALEQKVAA